MLSIKSKGKPASPHEAFCDGERMSNAVTPLILPVVIYVSIIRERIHDELVDFIQGEMLVAAGLNRHHDHGRKLVLWFFVAWKNKADRHKSLCRSVRRSVRLF